MSLSGSFSRVFASFDPSFAASKMSLFGAEMAKGLAAIARTVFVCETEGTELAAESVFLAQARNAQVSLFSVDPSLLDSAAERKLALFFEVDLKENQLFFGGFLLLSAFLTQTEGNPRVISKHLISPSLELALSSLPAPSSSDPQASLPKWATAWPAFFPADFSDIARLYKLGKEFPLEQLLNKRMETFTVLTKGIKDEKRAFSENPLECDILSKSLAKFNLKENTQARILADVLSRYAMCVYGFNSRDSSNSLQVVNWYFEREIDLFRFYLKGSILSELDLCVYLDGLDLEGLFERVSYNSLPVEVRHACNYYLKKARYFHLFRVRVSSASELLARHLCFTQGGFSFVTWLQVRDFCLPELLRSRMLAATQIPLPPESPISPDLQAEATQCARAAKEYSRYTIRPFLAEQLPDIEDCGKRLHAFPLCYELTRKKLMGEPCDAFLNKDIRPHHLNDHERWAYPNFLYDVGFPHHQVTNHLETQEEKSGTKPHQMKNDYFHMYHPRSNMNGEFGLGCAALMSDKVRGKVDSRREFYGCPFQYLQAWHLEDLLVKSGMEQGPATNAILDTAKADKNYAAACSMHFVAIHGEPDKELYPEPHKRPQEFTWRALIARNALKGQ